MDKTRVAVSFLFYLLSYIIKIICDEICKILVYTDLPILIYYQSSLLPSPDYSVSVSFFSLNSEKLSSQIHSYFLAKYEDEKNLDL